MGTTTIDWPIQVLSTLLMMSIWVVFFVMRTALSGSPCWLMMVTWFSVLVSAVAALWITYTCINTTAALAWGVLWCLTILIRSLI